MFVETSIAILFRFVKLKGKTKERRGKRAKFAETKESGTDHWDGGVEIDSGSDPDDEDLSQFLQSTATFVFNMTQTAAFTEAYIYIYPNSDSACDFLFCSSCSLSFAISFSC